MEREVDVVYTPSKWGAAYHALTQNEALGAGSAGPGKSWVLLADCNERIREEHKRCEDPNHPHPLRWGQSLGWALHLRRTRPMLEQTISRAHRMFNAMDSSVKWDQTKNIFTFSSGFKYQFGHCKDRDDWLQYLSAEFDWIGFDELVQFEQEQYDQIITRLRSADPVLRNCLKIRSMSNPMMRRDTNDAFSVNNPQWVREYFVEPHREGGVTLKRLVTKTDGTPMLDKRGKQQWATRIYLRATIEDNPDPIFREQYKATLASSKPHIKRALLDGDWWVTEGSFYSEWQPHLHICKPFKIPREWPVFRSMDWGFKLPGCVIWYALDPDDNMYAIRELTFRLKTDVQVARLVREIETQMGYWRGRKSLLIGPADSQLWEKRGDDDIRSKADVFFENGVPWIPASKRDSEASRSSNAQLLSKRLADHEEGTTTPGIVFFDTCKNCIRTIPAIQTDVGDPETPADSKDDHHHDNILYACRYASRGPKVLRKIEDTEKRFWEDDDEPVIHSRGRDGYGAEL